MQNISDDYMKEMIGKARQYSVVLLRATEKRREPGADAMVWEHGRRNFALRAEGLLPIVCPVTDGGDLAGIGIFTTSIEETRKIMDEDPGVRAGLFTFEVYQCRGFPGSSLT